LKPNHTSKTAKIILKLSVCVFLNTGLLLKTVILNYSTIWLLTPTLSKNFTITCVRIWDMHSLFYPLILPLLVIISCTRFCLSVSSAATRRTMLSLLVWKYTALTLTATNPPDLTLIPRYSVARAESFRYFGHKWQSGKYISGK